MQRGLFTTVMKPHLGTALYSSACELALPSSVLFASWWGKLVGITCMSSFLYITCIMRSFFHSEIPVFSALCLVVLHPARIHFWLEAVWETGNLLAVALCTHTCTHTTHTHTLIKVRLVTTLGWYDYQVHTSTSIRKWCSTWLSLLQGNVYTYTSWCVHSRSFHWCLDIADVASLHVCMHWLSS